MQRVCPSSSQLLGYPSSSFPGLLITICRALLGDTGMVLGPVGAKPEAKNRAVSGNGRNPLETMGNHRKMWGNRYCIYIYIILVGGFNPLKNIKVSWAYFSQYMEK